MADLSGPHDPWGCNPLLIDWGWVFEEIQFQRGARMVKDAWLWRRVCLHKATNSAYVAFMSIMLRCDHCGRTAAVARFTGSGRLDLRGTGWWLIGAGDAGSVTACSEPHLHEALAERNRRLAAAYLADDESAYA